LEVKVLPSLPKEEIRGLIEDLRATLVAGRLERVPELASLLRARCRTDEGLLLALIDVLLDPSQGALVREVAAFILASLPDLRAQKAVVRALEMGGDAAWIRTLVLALGSVRDIGRDGTFGYPGGPYIYTFPSGLGVQIQAVLVDPATREAVERQLAQSDVEVRQAVVQVLQHTLIAEAESRREEEPVDIGTVRQSFLTEMNRDPEESIRAEAARALSEWVLAAPSGSKGYDEVLTGILRKSFEPGEDQLRFRVLQGLKQSELPQDEVNVIADMAVRAEDFERRSWALALVATHAESLGAERAQALIATGAGDRDAKVREIAVRQLALLPGTEGTRSLALGSLQDPAWHVRYAAVEALKALGPDEESLRALERAGQADPNEEVRNFARDAAERLRGK
jgi:HEAT repeat protein